MLTIRVPRGPLGSPRAPRGSVRVAGLALTGLAVLGGTAACGGSGTSGGGGGRSEIVASFYPMAWVAGKVAGPDGSVRTLTKPGIEPHDLELTPRQVADIGKADFAVYVRGVQPAVDDAVAEHAKDKSLDAATVVKTLPPPTGEEEEHGHGEEGHADEEPTFDPHIWLDPSRLATVATALGDRLAAADPPHAAGYRSRAAATAAELNRLDEEFRTGLASCTQKTIVTAHAAFGYLADRYGLRQVSIAGVDPAAEPSPRRLAELTHQVKAAKATTIFTETLVSPRVAEALARSAGVRTAVLDPVEGVAPGSSADYLSIMRKNLATLKPALGCS
ncbi:zinc ABC transporter substrate-binding protein [Actinomadura sp. NBRC 104412]|uniref:metal ABC transporter substrate-binding protein n=1 Tax=Actinomadura sp. NBRC 104412 TaxID=3032203 RepID=UPI00249FE948|nr:metal ABC transporter substrate-binding protein [Actinomadura sp. NBRC 104412]GLZ04270.1 zinc ABC transporter substrate-binding protein [Actinomadura sp. NBRC 104412]